MLMKNRRRLFFAIVLVMAQSAHAADLVVLSSAAMKGALQDLPQRYLAATGDHVSVIYGTAGQVRDRALSGQAFDVVIVPPEPMKGLIGRHLVKDGSQLDIARVRLGLAVKAGAALPGIGDDQAFKQVLLNAPSIGMADPATGATSGIYLAKLIDRLGIGDVVGPKVKYYPEGQTAMEAMARGEVSVGLGQTSEIKPVHGVALVGPIPQDLQLVTTYAAGISAKSEHPDAAKKLAAWLTAPTVQTSLKANGFDLISAGN
jgi:molybdate transport system substrate-binding protein